MEIHKPKPIHNWREFLKEYAIIVLGVCTALAGETALEELHWRNQVREARQAIAAEMAQNVVTAIIMSRNQICAERRLDEVAQILDKASQTGALPPVGQVGRPAPRLWRTGTWESMVASQVVTHFPPQQLANMADVYTAVREARDMPELEAWTDLNAISGPGRRLDPTSETELRRALGRARYTTQSRAGLSGIVLQRTKVLHLPFSPQDLNLIASVRRAVQNSDKEKLPAALALVLPGGIPICKPMGQVPAHYGHVPLGDAPMTDERLNSLSDFSTP